MCNVVSASESMALFLASNGHNLAPVIGEIIVSKRAEKRCSAPFPFDRVIVDRDNNSTPGPNVEDENLMSALTNSLSFANSEFTFSNNLRLNSHWM